MTKQLIIKKFNKNFYKYLKKFKKVFKNKTFKYALISIVSSVATFTIIFLLIIANKNIILDKVFSLRNQQISDLVNQEIARDSTLQEASKLLENNANIALENEEKLKQEEVNKITEVLPKSIVDIVRTANPAVVAITLYKKVPNYDFVLNKDTNKVEQQESGTTKQKAGSGSGFIVSADGTIVTNRHVVDIKNVEYEITLNTGAVYKADVLDIDPVYDVAVLKINSAVKRSYSYLKLGDSDKINVGESVIAIGNALGELKNSVSVGIVSGLSRSVNASGNGLTEKLEQVIQTDAAINKGNSGGPLINLYGEVIGVNVATAVGSQSVSFALPINSIKDVISSVQKTGKISRPFVGIRYSVITKELQLDRDLPVSSGILIVKGSGEDSFAVMPGSPAEKAGIREGDIITQINNQMITKDADFALLIRNKKVGDVMSMKILRNGVEVYAYVVLGEAK